MSRRRSNQSSFSCVLSDEAGDIRWIEPRTLFITSQRVKLKVPLYMLHSFLSDFKVQHLQMFAGSKIRLAMNINIKCAVLNKIVYHGHYIDKNKRCISCILLQKIIFTTTTK